MLPAGSTNVSADIFRGTEVPPGAFDWMVNMKAYMQDTSTGEVFEQHLCGGALIAPDAVLTGERQGRRSSSVAVGSAECPGLSEPLRVCPA